MKRFLLTIGLCLCTLGVAVGQSTIAFQGFEGTGSDTWTISSGAANVSTADGSGDTPASQRLRTGSNSWQVSNSTSTLELGSVSVSGYTDVKIVLYLSSTAGTSGNGADGADEVGLFVNVDGGGFPGTADIEIAGNNNARWGYAATGDSTEAGTSIARSGSGGTNNGTIYSRLVVSVPNGSSTVALQVVADNNNSAEYWNIDDISLIGTSASGTPEKLVVTSVNSSSSPSNGTTFDVVVQAQENDGSPANVSGAVGITLTKATGSGTLGGTLTGTIADGTNEITISGVTYNTTESGVSITASDDASNLTAGTSSTFEVLAAADQLVLVDAPTTGVENNALDSFTVEARRSGDSSVDLNYTKSITVSKASGTGSISGTLSKAASSGVSTFDDIVFDAASTFTISATDGSLTSAASGNIVVSEAPALIISEVADPGDEFSGRFIELFNAGTSTIDFDTDDYFAVRQTNGGGISSFQLTGSIAAGETFVIANNATNFNTHYSSTPDQSSTTIAANGDDAYWIATDNSDDASLKSSIVDIYGEVDQDGTGRDWEFEDSRAVRNKNIKSAKSTWDSDEWVITSADIADMEPGEHDFGFKTQITGNAGWRMLSFPISGGAAEDISDDTAIQGVSGGDNTDKTSNFQTYDNTGAFETPASVSTNLGNGYGFITYFYNNTDAGSSTLPITLDAAGTEPSSNVSVDLNTSNAVSSSYYTMAGNPFATNFNLNSITATGGSIQNNVHFWDDGSGSYSPQDRTTPYIVEPWQGFWVETTSASVTAISMPTSGKTTTAATGTFFSKENPDRGDINFTLSSETTFDKAIRLSARPNAVLGYDVADASKFTPLVNSYATMAFVGKIDNEDKLQSVFSVPSNLEEEITIPLRISTHNASGEFTFAWEDVETVSENWVITLTDYETGNTVSLRDVSSYTFTVNQQSQKSTSSVLAVATTMESNDGETNRFGITIAPGTSVGIDDEIDAPTEFTLGQNYPNPFNPTTNINYSVGEAGPVNITVYNLMGQKVAELLNTTKNAGSYQITWNATGVASGIYYYRLTAPGQVLTRQMTLIK